MIVCGQIFFFTITVMVSIVGLGLLLGYCVTSEWRKERSDFTYSAGVSVSLFIFTSGLLEASQFWIGPPYHHGVSLAFALMVAFSAGGATFFARYYLHRVRGRGSRELN